MHDSTALLVMHFQNKIVADFGGDALLPPVKRAIAAARRNGVRVIYVRFGFNEGYPEANPRNKQLVTIKEEVGLTLLDDPQMQIHEAVRPEQDEPVVSNYRISAFAGSRLEIVLRSLGIDTLVLTGISTGGVVLSTLTEAADKDYALKVLSDGTAELDDGLQRVFVEKVFAPKAEVLTADEWIASLG